MPVQTRARTRQEQARKSTKPSSENTVLPGRGSATLIGEEEEEEDQRSPSEADVGSTENETPQPSEEPTPPVRELQDSVPGWSPSRHIRTEGDDEKPGHEEGSNTNQDSTPARDEVLSEEPQPMHMPNQLINLLRSVQRLEKEAEKRYQQLQTAVDDLHGIRTVLWDVIRPIERIGRIDFDPEMRNTKLFDDFLRSLNASATPLQRQAKQAYFELKYIVDNERYEANVVADELQAACHELIDFLAAQIDRSSDSRSHNGSRPDCSPASIILNKVDERYRSVVQSLRAGELGEDLSVDYFERKASATGQARERFLDARRGLNRAQAAVEHHFNAYQYPKHVQEYENLIEDGEELPPVDLCKFTQSYHPRL